MQWLGELYRKFHQVFVLIDEERIESVARDYGEGNNPFDVHPFSVIASELLEAQPALAAWALEADMDVIVVDEAHRLSRPEVLKVTAPLVAHARHALLLTATPLAADQRGFFHLLHLLHPERFPEYEGFAQTVSAGDAVFTPPPGACFRRR